MSAGAGAAADVGAADAVDTAEEVCAAEVCNTSSSAGVDASPEAAASQARPLATRARRHCPSRDCPTRQVRGASPAYASRALPCPPSLATTPSSFHEPVAAGEAADTGPAAGDSTRQPPVTSEVPGVPLSRAAIRVGRYGPISSQRNPQTTALAAAAIHSTSAIQAGSALAAVPG